MKVKGEIHNPDGRYNFIERTKTFSKRLDLNDLLKRAKERREKDKKLNILIFSGATTLAAIVLVIFSL